MNLIHAFFVCLPTPNQTHRVFHYTVHTYTYVALDNRDRDTENFCVCMQWWQWGEERKEWVEKSIEFPVGVLPSFPHHSSLSLFRPFSSKGKEWTELKRAKPQSHSPFRIRIRSVLALLLLLCMYVLFTNHVWENRHRMNE
jgi:hypothetical protein